METVLSRLGCEKEEDENFSGLLQQIKKCLGGWVKRCRKRID